MNINMTLNKETKPLYITTFDSYPESRFCSFFFLFHFILFCVDQHFPKPKQKQNKKKCRFINVIQTKMYLLDINSSPKTFDDTISVVIF